MLIKGIIPAESDVMKGTMPQSQGKGDGRKTFMTIAKLLSKKVKNYARPKGRGVKGATRHYNGRRVLNYSPISTTGRGKLEGCSTEEGRKALGVTFGFPACFTTISFARRLNSQQVNSFMLAFRWSTF